MALYLMRRSDGRYIACTGVTVHSQAYAHDFQCRKQAIEFLDESGLKVEDFEFVNCSPQTEYPLTRGDLVGKYHKKRP